MDAVDRTYAGATMPLPRNLLWIDDQIDQYGPWIKRFQEHGTQVDSVASLGDAVQKLQSNSYDVILLDVMLNHESCINKLAGFHTQFNGANIVLCSSYFYLPDVLNQFREMQHGPFMVRGMDKTYLPFTDDSSAVVRFLRELNTGRDQDPASGAHPKHQSAAEPVPFSHRLMFSLDLCLPPDKAEEILVALQDVFQNRWLVRYSERTARLICICHVVSVITAYHWKRIARTIQSIFVRLGDAA